MLIPPGRCGQHCKVVVDEKACPFPRSKVDEEALAQTRSPTRKWNSGLALLGYGAGSQRLFRGHLNKTRRVCLAQAPLERNRKAPLGGNSPQVNSLSLPPMRGAAQAPSKGAALEPKWLKRIHLSLSLSPRGKRSRGVQPRRPARGLTGVFSFPAVCRREAWLYEERFPCTY